MIKRKKVCFVASSPQSINAFLKNFIDIFFKNKYEIYLISNFSVTTENLILSRFLKKYNKKKIKKIHIPFKRKPSIFLDIFCLIMLIKFFLKNRINLQISITPKAGFLSSLAGTLTRNRNRFHIFTGQVWYNKYGIKRYLLKIVDKIIANFNPVSLADSHSQKDFLISEGIFSKLNNKLHVISKGSICGVDTNKFVKCSLKKKQLLKKKYQIDLSSKVILYLGRLNEDKGVLDLASAFKLVNKNYKGKLILIFVGVDEENCKKKILLKKSFSEKILFFNYNTNPEEFMQISDIFCLPSYREGFGLSALEAGSCEVPIITSNTVGLLDVNIHNVTGLIHNPGDINAIKLNILKLLKNNSLREQFGRNARQRAIKFFFHNDIIKSYFNYFVNFTHKNKIAIIGTLAHSIYNFRGQMIKFLQKKNYIVSAFSGSVNTSDLKKIENLKISYYDYKVSNVKFNLFNELRSIFSLFWQLSFKDFKIFFTYTLKAVIFIGLIKKFGFFRKVKTVAFITGIGNAFIDYNRSIYSYCLFLIIKYLYVITLKTFNIILFQNKEDVLLFKKLNIIKNSNQISIIPGSGVDVGKFKDIKQKKQIVFGLASRMIHNKGIIEFCKAAKEIKKKYKNKNIKFIVTGEFNSGLYSLNEKKMKGIFKNSGIKFLGWSDDIKEFFSLISIYVLPSYREGLPRSILEAMASSKPIITTNTAGCKDTVYDGKNGFLVKVKDHNELKNAMTKFIEKPSLLNSMGKKSFAIVKKKYNVEKINTLIYKEIKHVMQL